MSGERLVRLKVFIAVDLEGVSGYVQWDAADRAREREFVTEEVNAAAQGAFEGGASEVLVTEAHGNMRNILPEKIDQRCVFLSGKPKPLCHMAGIDGSFQAAILVGYHAKAGTTRGVMAHTFTGDIFSLRFNGVEVGELGTDAAIAGHFGVPIVLVSGDTATCQEARDLLGDVETVAVKEGTSRYAAKCIPPVQARRMIKEAATRVVRNVSSRRPFAFTPPIRVELTFTEPSLADIASYSHFAQRIDGRGVAFTAPDFLQAFELFNAVRYLATSARL